MPGGLLLTASVALLVWLAVRRRPWLARVGRAVLDGLATSGEWYAEGYEYPNTEGEVPEDLVSRTEASMAADLLDRVLAKEDYQQAMAKLAADDEARHPMSVPQWP